jgi:hypothetical protein
MMPFLSLRRGNEKALASRPGKQMNLADVVPDGDVLVALEPKELGLRIL